MDRATCDPAVDCEYGENVPRVRFVDYCKHLHKVNDAVVWAFETLAKKEGLDYVTGGWVGGAAPPDEEDFTHIEWREKWETMFPEYK